MAAKDLEFLTLEDITCVDADGKVFERYDRLEVAKKIFCKDHRDTRNFTPYSGAVYCESQGLFLPSFALSCNIVAALYANRTNPDAELVLQQYRDYGEGFGYHAQNTIIDYATEQIMHYPTAADSGKGVIVNRDHPSNVLRFRKARLCDSILEDVLNDQDQMHFVRQLTGLKNPEVLVDIGKYFRKPTKMWFPWDGQNGAQFTEKRMAWFGCGNTVFYLSSYFSLGGINAARGVRCSEP